MDGCRERGNTEALCESVNVIQLHPRQDPIDPSAPSAATWRRWRRCWPIMMAMMNDLSAPPPLLSSHFFMIFLWYFSGFFNKKKNKKTRKCRNLVNNTVRPILFWIIQWWRHCPSDLPAAQVLNCNSIPSIYLCEISFLFESTGCFCTEYDVIFFNIKKTMCCRILWLVSF